ncbi:MAG: DUF305 domain-containing protein [Patescibacteria group bacterium]
MNKYLVITIVSSLLLGVLGGLAGGKIASRYQRFDQRFEQTRNGNMFYQKGGMMQGSAMMQGGHMMPDGTMMGGATMGQPGMRDMMMDMTSSMRGKTGDELDKAFLAGMIEHHQGAIDMAKILKDGTKRPELQKMADDIINVQSKEIEMMQQWQKEWFATATTTK